MRKFFIFTLIILTTVLYANANDLKFTQALSQCSLYSERGTFSTDGMNVYSDKQILGWANDKCVYKETVRMQETNACIICRFTKSQIAELTSVMQAYDTLQKYSDSNVDTSSVNAVKDNPIVKVWSKYLQNSSVCEMNI